MTPVMSSDGSKIFSTCVGGIGIKKRTVILKMYILALTSTQYCAKTPAGRHFQVKRRIAIIGDIHGCIDELTELYGKLRADGISEVYHLGDLVDRGPDSVGVIRFCRDNQIFGIMGNHESSLLNVNDQIAKPDFDPRKLSVAKLEPITIAQRLAAEDIDYIRALPKLHVIDEFNLVLVHAGLYPTRPLYLQDRTVLYMQMIHPDRSGDIRWTSKQGQYTNEESRALGYAPWQELYDGAERVIHGHTVYGEPNIQGLTTGIDTGCVFGGSLTALIIPDEKFIQVKAKMKYAERHEGYGS